MSREAEQMIDTLTDEQAVKVIEPSAAFDDRWGGVRVQKDDGWHWIAANWPDARKRLAPTAEPEYKPHIGGKLADCRCVRRMPYFDWSHGVGCPLRIEAEPLAPQEEPVQPYEWPDPCFVAIEKTGGKFTCTRSKGHEGPCAAVPITEEQIQRTKDAAYRAIDEFKAKEEPAQPDPKDARIAEECQVLVQVDFGSLIRSAKDSIGLFQEDIVFSGGRDANMCHWCGRDRSDDSSVRRGPLEGQHKANCQFLRWHKDMRAALVALGAHVGKRDEVSSE